MPNDPLGILTPQTSSQKSDPLGILEKKNPVGNAPQPSSNAVIPASVNSGATGTQLPQQSGSTVDNNLLFNQQPPKQVQDVTVQKPFVGNTNISSTLQQQHDVAAQKDLESTDKAVVHTAKERLQSQNKPVTPQNLNNEIINTNADLKSGKLSVSYDKDGNKQLQLSAGFWDGVANSTGSFLNNLQYAPALIKAKMTGDTKALSDIGEQMTKDKEFIANHPYTALSNFFSPSPTGALQNSIEANTTNDKEEDKLNYKTNLGSFGQTAGNIGTSLAPLLIPVAGEAVEGAEGAEAATQTLVQKVAQNYPRILAGAAQTYLNNVPENFNNLYQQNKQDLMSKGMSEDDAKKASAQKSSSDALVEGILPSLAGGAFFSGAFDAGTAANNFGDAALDMMKNSAKFSTIMGAQQGAENLIKQWQGYKVSGLDGVGEAMKSGFLQTMAMDLLPHALSLPSYLKNTLYNYASKNIAEPTLQAHFKNMPDGAKISQDFISFKDVLAKIPDEVPDDKKVQIASLLQEKQNISDKSQGKEKVLTDAVYKPQLEAIDNKINDIITQPAAVPTPNITPASDNIQPTETFRTLNYGDHTGEPESKAKQDEIKQDIISDNPIGNTGEKFSDFVKRVVPAFKNVLDNEDNNTTLVTHSSVIKALDVWNDMGRPDVDKMDESQMKDFANNYTKEDVAKEGDLTTFKSDNGNEIHVARHGETEDNKMSEFRSNDTQLTDKGEKQAAQAGHELNKLTNGDVPKIITSDLPRTIHTSNIISDQLTPEKESAHSIGDVIDTEHGKAKITGFGDNSTKIEFEDGRKGILIGDISKYKITPNKAVSTETEVSSISDALKKHDNTENYTFNDMVNDIEGLNNNSKKVNDVIEQYREAQKENEKLKGRGDMDSAEKELRKILESEPQSKEVPSIENKKWNSKGNLVIEPHKPISEMNSDELSEYAKETKKALRKQDIQFENKTEEEKQKEGYNDTIDNVEDLRDAAQRVNFVENSEDINDLASSIKSTVLKMDKDNLSEYDKAVLNAAKNKAIEMGIGVNDLIKKVLEKTANQYKDIDDATTMMKDVFDRLTKSEPQSKEVPSIENKQLPSRQEKVNNIVDDVRRYNEMRRNSPDKPSLENDIKLRAQELGLTIKKNGDVMSALNDSGNNIKKANIEKNSTTAKDFNKENYLPETQDFIDNKLTNDNWQNLPPVKGYDGKTLSLGQMEAAVKELKEGNVTNAGKAIYDTVDKVFKDDNVNYSDKRLNFIHNEKMSSGDFVKQFDNPVNEATDENIKSLHELMGDEAFEKYFNELKSQEDEFNKESYPANPTSEAGRTENGVNPTERDGQGSAKEDKTGNVGETTTTPESVVEKSAGNTGAERKSSTPESDVPDEVESNRRYNEKVEFARKNSYKYFKEEYPDIPVDEYNQLRSSEPKETYKIDTNDHTIFPEENAPQMAGSGAMFPGLSPFISRDIAPQIPKTADAAKSWFKSVRDTIKSWYEPDSAKELTKATLRPYLANIAELKDAAWSVVKARRRMWDKVPEETKYKFIDAIETGKYSEKDFKALGFNDNNSKMFSGVAKEYRERLDAMHMLEKTYKEQAQYIDNYFPHIWEKPETAQEFFSNYTSKMSKQGFEKTRTIDLIKAGLDKGLKLKTTNPEEIVLMREFGGYQRKNMVDFMDKMKEQGLVRLAFPDSETGKFAVPDGFKKLKDDPFNKMKIFFDQKNGVPVFAAGAEDVIENYLSPSLYNREDFVGKLFKGNMVVKNFTTGMRLGLSLYHIVNTVGSDVATQFSLAIKNALRGDFGKFATNLLKTPISPLADFFGQTKFGKYIGGEGNVIKGWDKPETRTPEIQTAIDLIKRGGGRVHLSEIWQAGLKDKFNDAVDEYRNSNFIGGTLRVIPAAMELINKGTLEGIVGRLKIASYLKLANDYIDNTNETDEVKQNQALGKIWDSHDNRFGQFVYENLFWKRWVRDIGTASTLSLGWNLGTIREFGGAVKDLPQDIINSIKNKKPEFSDRVLFTAAYTAQAAIVGGMMTYLLSGKHPKEMKDYFYPCDKRNEDGSCAHRMQMPSMTKEYFSLKQSLQAKGTLKGSATYLTNKLAPQISAAIDLLQNKSYQNIEIRNTEDPVWDQAKQVAGYISENELVPISVIAALKSDHPVLAIAGVTPASDYISNTDMENRIINRYNELNQNLKPYSTKETKDISTKIKSLYASGDKSAMEAYIHNVVDEGKMSPTSIRGILKSINKHQTVFQYLFGKLPKTDQYHMYKDMTDEEKKQFDPSGKVGKMVNKMDKQTDDEDN